VILNHDDSELTLGIQIIRAFISGPGVYSDRSRVTVEPGDDPNYPGEEKMWAFSCYSSSYKDADEDQVFPFHWPCYELLARALAGTDDVKTATKQVDNDVLNAVMRSIVSTYPRHLDLDYGASAKAHSQWWRCILGYEFVVAPFDDRTQVNAVLLLRSIISSNSFQLPAVNCDLGPKVRNDPFQKLPREILHMIISFVRDNDSVLRLCRASWLVHCALRVDEPFWRGRIRTTLPCFFELHRLIADDRELLRGKSLKGLLLAVDSLTWPRKHMRGPFMGLANRRRIWSVCEQIAHLYLSTIL